MTATPPTTYRRDGPTLLLYAALAVFGALQVVPGSVAPQLRAELGYGYGEAGLHLSAYAAGSVLAGLAGPLLDRRPGRRAVLLAGLLGGATGAVGLTLGQALPATLAAALVIGLLGTLVLVVVQAGLSDHHGAQRAVAFAESNVLASAGATAAPLLIGTAAAVLGSWRWGVLALAAALALVAVRARTAVLPEPTADDSGPRAGRLPAAARAGIALVFAGVVLEWCVGYWGATYLRDEVGLPTGTAVSAVSSFFLAMLAGRAAGGVLVRRADPARLVLAGLGLAAVGLAVQAATTSAVLVVVGLVPLGLGVAVLFPFGLALAVAGAPDRAAAVGSRCITAGGVAVLLGPLVVGALADAVGLRAALLVLPVALVGALLALRLTTRRT